MKKHHEHLHRGFLGYIILWILRNKPLKGSEISEEIEKRKGKKLSPGTLYPALKDLKEKGLIVDDEEKRYSLTKKGEKEMQSACSHFCKFFYDMHEMFNCCKDNKC